MEGLSHLFSQPTPRPAGGVLGEQRGWKSEDRMEVKTQEHRECAGDWGSDRSDRAISVRCGGQERRGPGVAAVSLRCELHLCCPPRGSGEADLSRRAWALASLGYAWFLAHSCQHSCLP